jgi:hypothetical protein
MSLSASGAGARDEFGCSYRDTLNMLDHLMDPNFTVSGRAVAGHAPAEEKMSALRPYLTQMVPTTLPPFTSRAFVPHDPAQ